MKDELTNWRTAAAGNLTATATLTGIDLKGQFPHVGSFDAVVHVPSVSGTSPTLDITVQEAQTVGGSYRTIQTMPTITAAGTYKVRVVNNRRAVRFVLTVGGTTPNFGAVHVGLDEGNVQNDMKLGATL